MRKFFEPSSENKIIVLISLPRSNSTVFCRMVQNTDQMTIIHEPGIFAYHKSLDTPQFESALTKQLQETHLDSYGKVASHIIDLSKRQPVFVKDMAFAAVNYAPLLLAHKNVSFFFLTRHPGNLILSNYKKISGAVNDITNDVLSFEKFYRLYSMLYAKCPEKTFIINSHALLTNPEEIITQFCSQASIPYNKSYLQWSALEPQYLGLPGNGRFKVTDDCVYSEYWHHTAIKSTHFDQELTSIIKTDIDGNPTFEEIPAEHRTGYINLYHQQLPFYQSLTKAYNEQQGCDNQNAIKRC